MDQQLKQLMKELGEAINESLADSEQIAEVVSKIKEGGYDIFLVLEATIGVSKPGEKSSDKTSMVTTLTSNPEFKVNDQDLKFLKSLRIKIDDRTLELPSTGFIVHPRCSPVLASDPHLSLNYSLLSTRTPTYPGAFSYRSAALIARYTCRSGGGTNPASSR